MPAFILFILKSITISSVLMLYYWLVLRRKKMHVFNRFYLSGTAICSFLLPLLHFNVHYSAPITAGAQFAIRKISYFSTDTEFSGPVTTPAFNLSLILAFIYCLISGVLLVNTLVRVAMLFRIKKVHRIVAKGQWDMVHTTLPQAPFSFMKTLFWNDHISPDSEDGQRILLHELNHIRQWHTLDKLLMQGIIILFWANPVYWLIRHELSLQHEFLADAAAIKPADTDAFARMLLTSKHPGLSLDLVHSFFHSSIQRRLFMITQTSNIRFRSLRALLVLPLLGLLTVATAFDTDHAPAVQAKHKITVILDAGHGGTDIGARNDAGAQEKELTFIITRKMAEIAGRYNIEMVPTRNADVSMALNERVKVGEQTPADLFISIHINKSPKEGDAIHPYGLIVSRKNKAFAASNTLASAIGAQLETMQIKAPLTDQHLLVLRENKLPAVAIECGNIDNPGQMAMLTDERQLTNFCEKILSGIVSYDNYLHKHR